MLTCLNSLRFYEEPQAPGRSWRGNVRGYASASSRSRGDLNCTAHTLQRSSARLRPDFALGLKARSTRILRGYESNHKRRTSTEQLGVKLAGRGSKQRSFAPAPQRAQRWYWWCWLPTSSSSLSFAEVWRHRNPWSKLIQHEDLS